MPAAVVTDPELELASKGLALGLVYVLTGADHLSAIAALAVGRRWSAGVLGVCWGMGHATGLLFMIAASLLMNLNLSAQAPTCGSIVGVFMVLLGLGSGFRELGRNGDDCGIDGVELATLDQPGGVSGLAAALDCKVEAYMRGRGRMRLGPALVAAARSLRQPLSAMPLPVPSCSNGGRAGGRNADWHEEEVSLGQAKRDVAREAAFVLRVEPVSGDGCQSAGGGGSGWEQAQEVTGKELVPALRQALSARGLGEREECGAVLSAALRAACRTGSGGASYACASRLLADVSARPGQRVLLKPASTAAESPIELDLGAGGSEGETVLTALTRSVFLVMDEAAVLAEGRAEDAGTARTRSSSDATMAVDETPDEAELRLTLARVDCVLTEVIELGFGGRNEAGSRAPTVRRRRRQLAMTLWSAGHAGGEEEEEAASGAVATWLVPGQTVEGMRREGDNAGDRCGLAMSDDEEAGMIDDAGGLVNDCGEHCDNESSDDDFGDFLGEGGISVAVTAAEEPVKLHQFEEFALILKQRKAAQLEAEEVAARRRCKLSESSSDDDGEGDVDAFAEKEWTTDRLDAFRVDDAEGAFDKMGLLCSSDDQYDGGGHSHSHRHNRGVASSGSNGSGGGGNLLVRHAGERLAFTAGIVHGVAGTGTVLGVLSAVALRDVRRSAVYLSCFCASSIATMVAFAASYGECSARLAAGSERSRRALALLSAGLALMVGVAWLVPLHVDAVRGVWMT